jgi:CubicO group peptidase (beta-lactamase class C family)
VTVGISVTVLGAARDQQFAAVIACKYGQDDEEERVTSGGFSSKRLTRVRDVLSRHLDAGYVPGAVAVVARHGEVHIEAMGNLAFEGAGSRTPMAADTICRMGSMTKPIVAACAMTLVEDCTLRLDDPVDEFLPELADMSVLADPGGPLEDTVPAKRPVTLRDLLTFTLGTGIVVAEPGTDPDRRRAERAPRRGARAAAGRVDSPARRASARLPAGRALDVPHRRQRDRRAHRPGPPASPSGMPCAGGSAIRSG